MNIASLSLAELRQTPSADLIAYVNAGRRACGINTLITPDIDRPTLIGMVIGTDVINDFRESIIAEIG